MNSPFTLHRLVESFAGTIHCLLPVGNNELWVSAGSGDLHIYKYKISESAEDGQSNCQCELYKIHKAIARRPIESMVHIPSLDSVVILSGSQLYRLPLQSDLIVNELLETKGTLLFCASTGYEYPSTAEEQMRGAGPRISRRSQAQSEDSSCITVDRIAVVKKRSVIVIVFAMGIQQHIVIKLQHTPRTFAFVTPEKILCSFNSTEHALILLSYLDPIDPNNMSSSVQEFVLPSAPSINSSVGFSGNMGTLARGVGMNALGYMGLGGKLVKPAVLRVGEGEGVSGGEALVCKDSLGIFLNPDAKPTRRRGIEFTTPFDEIVYSKPYLITTSFSTLPLQNTGSSPALGSSPTTSLLTSLTSVGNAQSTCTNIDVRALSSLEMIQSISISGATANLCSSFAHTSPKPPVFFTLNNGISMLVMYGWKHLLSILIVKGQWSEALALLDDVGADEDEKEAHRRKILSLNAVSNFIDRNFHAAIDIFIELQTNPAHVLALFGKKLSGRLSQPVEKWYAIFGSDFKIASNTVTWEEDNREAVESLLRFLTDRRQSLARANGLPLQTKLETLLNMPALSTIELSDLYSRPSLAPSELSLDDVIIQSRIIDTALFKAYLQIRPGLLGPLCRLENWCEIEEISDILRSTGKISELVALFQGKGKHRDALSLLKEVAENGEDKDPDIYLEPSINYMNKLDYKSLDIVFEYSTWIINQDSEYSLRIFTADNENVQSYPHLEVLSYLTNTNDNTALAYAEYLIYDLRDSTPSIHDTLIGLYMKLYNNATTDSEKTEVQQTLLEFLRFSRIWDCSTYLARFTDYNFTEACAIALGYLSQHQRSLKIYVYELKSPQKAESHCVQFFNDFSEIFSQLLRLYLTGFPLMLDDAVDLINKHAAKLDIAQTLKMMPSQVPIQKLNGILAISFRNLQNRQFSKAYQSSILPGHIKNIEMETVQLKSQHVLVGLHQCCKLCDKRLGNTPLAVFSGRDDNEPTMCHLSCKNLFIKRIE